MHLSKLDDLEPFTTLDGSTIREIAGPAWTPARNQSLAEATVPVGGRTVAHYHRVTEELYFFTAGRGRTTLGDEYEFMGYSSQEMNEFAFTALSRRLKVIGVGLPTVTV